MVKYALDEVTRHIELNGFEKVMLWEEISEIIFERIGLPISSTFTGVVDGQLAYIFESRKRFNGRAYYMVIKASGEILKGLGVPPNASGQLILSATR